MEFGLSTYQVVGKERIAVNLLVTQMIFALWPWFIFFYVSGGIQYALGPVLAFLSLLISPSSFRLTHKSLGISLLLLIAAILGTEGNLNAYLASILRCIPFLVFMAAKQRVRIEVISTFNNWFIGIISVSLFFWILHLIGIPLLHTHLDTVADNTYEFDNYFFFIRNTHYLFADSFFPRFNSIFLEPGYVACFIVLMLFLDKFDFRKPRTIIYMVALVLTFSLAGWLFFFVALIPYVNQRGRTKWAYIGFLAIIVIAFVFFNNSSETNVVNSMIGNRLRIENGEMVGYNRANDELETLWKQGFLSSPDALWGLRNRYYSQHDFGASVDARAYIIRFGVIAFLFYVWFLVRCLRAKWSSKGLWVFIIVALFAYRGYSIMFNDALLFVYIGSLDFLMTEDRYLREKNKMSVH